MALKLKRLIIGTLVGTFVLLVGMFVAWNMTLYKPLKEKTAKAAADYTTQKADADKLTNQVMLRKQARDEGALYTTELAEMRQRYRSFSFDVTTDAARKRTWQAYIEEFSKNYGLKVERQIIYAAERSGCKPIKATDLAIRLQALPQVPEDLVVPTTGFMKPLVPGDINMSIEGSYGDIIRFFDQLNRPVEDPEAPGEMLNILFVIKNNLKLSGYSPNIKATFTITPYLIAVGPSVTLPAGAPPAPAGGAPAAGAPAAGAPATPPTA